MKNNIANYAGNHWWTEGTAFIWYADKKGKFFYGINKYLSYKAGDCIAMTFRLCKKKIK